MKNQFTIPGLGLLALSLFCANCTRTTAAHGFVTHTLTGEPIAGFKVTLMVFNGHEPPDSNTPKLVGEETTETDQNGAYDLEISDTGIDEASLFVSAEGITYFTSETSGPLRQNSSNAIDFRITPIDGKLKIVLENLSGQHDSLYLRVDCEGLQDLHNRYCFHSFENQVPAGQSDTIPFSITAKRFVRIYWGETRFANWDAPHVDSVFCPRGDTTTFTISY